MMDDWARNVPQTGPISRENVLAVGRDTVDQRWFLPDGGISDPFGTPIRIEISGSVVTLTSAGWDRRFGTWDDYWTTAQFRP